MAKRNRWITAFAAGLVIAASVCAESLYDPSTYRPLSIDQRARAAGDTLTVLIFESATASSRASTMAGRRSNLEVRAADFGEPMGGELALRNEFDGGGEESRTGQLIAQITVTVKDVLPNGDLLVRGDQKIALNNESQRIHIEGRVRPQDVLADNTILSSRMADATIEFQGRGLLSAREKPGLLARFFHWLL